MASNISTTGLDEQFPVAGRDNDSQGFRDNFANIKTNLDYAKTEIDDLQDGVARKDTDNNFDGNTQSNMLLQNTSILSAEQTSPTNGGDFESANVQYYTLTGSPLTDITIALTNYPTSGYSNIRFVIRNSDSSSHTATFTTTDFANTFVDDNASWSSQSVTIAAGEAVVIDAFSPQGTDVYLNYVGTFS
jgi:hypothetical protein